MNRNVPSSLCPYFAPMRWLKVAAAYADQEMAKLCSNHWRSSVLVPIAGPVRERRPRAR